MVLPICTEEWNLNQDAGYPLEKATNDLIKTYPNYKSYIKMYYGRWEEMLGGVICGTCINLHISRKA